MLSTEYRNVLYNFDKNFSVKAGAGSGKTSSLVKLISSILEGQSSLGETSIGEILAMTFTELAAGEMKERICSMIDEKIRILADIDSEELWKWRETRKEFAGANISTINSFCLKILKENPFEAGISSVETIDELKSSELLNKAGTLILIDAFNNKEFDIVTDLYSFKDLKNYIINLYKSTREVMEIPMLRAITEKSLSIIDRELRYNFISQVKEICNSIQNIDNFLSEHKIKKKQSITIEKLRESIFQLNDFYDKYYYVDDIDILFSDIDRFSGDLDNISSLKLPNNKALQEIKDDILIIQGGSDPDKQAKCISSKLKDSITFLFGKVKDTTFAFILLIEKLSEKYESLKKDIGAIDFSDQIILSRRLLLENLKIRKKYKEKFKLVAVDEFQDVNRRQNDIILLLCEKKGCEKDYLIDENTLEKLPSWKVDMMSLLKSGKLATEKKLFIVGDLKQAIYGFRGGDISVFSDMLDYMENDSGCSKMDFSENFRTLNSIIYPLNMFFADIMPNQFKKASDNTMGDELIAARKSDKSAFEIISFNSDDKVKEPEVVVQWLLNSLPEIDIEDKTTKLTRKASFGDVAMLFKKATKINDFVAELKKANIPYVLESGKNFYSSEEISHIISLFELLFSKNLRLNEAIILRSPFCGISNSSLKSIFDFMNSATIDFFEIPDEKFSAILSENELPSVLRFIRIFKNLQKQAPFLSPSNLLKRISEDFSYILTLEEMPSGKSRVANVKKLFEIAAKFEKSSNFAVDFIRFVASRKSNDNETEASLIDRSAVRIMTVHKSKGMEFPIVLLCGTNQKTQNIKSKNYAFNRFNGATLKIAEKNGEKKNNVFFDRIIDTEEEISNNESLRTLYVASTRARDYFATIVDFKKSKGQTQNSNFNKDNWGECFKYFLNKHGYNQLDFTQNNTTDLTSVFSESFIKLKYNDKNEFSLKISKYEKKDDDTDSDLTSYDILPEDKDNSCEIPSDLDDEIASAISPKRAIGTMLYITPSKFLTWKLCKRRYLYESFRDSGEGAFRGTQLLSGPFDDEALLKGSLAHAILQDIDFSCKFKTKSISYSDYLRQCSDRETERLLKLINDECISPECVDSVKHDIYNFFDFSEPLNRYFRPDSLFMPEHKIYFSLGENTKIYVDGLIDLVIKTADDHIAVIDYKYGKNSKDKAAFYEDQLKMYCLGISKVEGIDISKIRAFLVFLRDGVEVREVDISKNSLDSFEIYIEKIAKEILSTIPSEDNYQKNEELCSYLTCPYLERCHAIKH